MPSTKCLQDALRKCEFPILVRCIRHNDPELRCQIAQALERFYDEPEAIMALRDMLHDGDNGVLEAVLKALERATECCEYPPAWADLLEGEDRGEKVALELKRTLNSLMELVRSTLPANLRASALEILSFEVTEDEAGPLVELCEDHEYLVRAAALSVVAVVGRISGRQVPRAADVFLTALGDPYPEVRAKAAEELGGIGARTALEPLKGLLGDESQLVVGAALEALGRIGRATEVLELLLGYLKQQPETVNQALKYMCNKEDTEALSPLLRHPQETVREASVEALCLNEEPEKVFCLLLSVLEDAELHSWASDRISKILEEPYLWMDPEITSQEISGAFSRALGHVPSPKVRRFLQEE